MFCVHYRTDPISLEVISKTPTDCKMEMRPGLISGRNLLLSREYCNYTLF